jgi:hypothetical protein
MAAQKNQSSGDRSKTLADLINGTTFETNSNGKVERYKYDKMRLERCSLMWTEAHEIWEHEAPGLAELSEIIVPLSVIDLKAMRIDKLKDSGAVVSIVTKRLEPAISHRDWAKWPGEPAAESIGNGTGTAFYFADRSLAEKVFKMITTVASSCPTS